MYPIKAAAMLMVDNLSRQSRNQTG
jgi:hypothetical protein